MHQRIAGKSGGQKLISFVFLTGMHQRIAGKSGGCERKGQELADPTAHRRSTQLSFGSR